MIRVGKAYSNETYLHRYSTPMAIDWSMLPTLRVFNLYLVLSSCIACICYSSEKKGGPNGYENCGTYTIREFASGDVKKNLFYFLKTLFIL